MGVALSVSLSSDHKGLTAKLLGAVDFDMADHFQPTADNYLGRISNPFVVAALTEAKQVNGNADKEGLLAMKKGVLAAEAEKRLAGTGWLPKPIRGPKPKKQAETKPAAKGKAPTVKKVSAKSAKTKPPAAFAS